MDLDGTEALSVVSASFCKNELETALQGIHSASTDLSSRLENGLKWSFSRSFAFLTSHHLHHRENRPVTEKLDTLDGRVTICMVYCERYVLFDASATLLLPVSVVVYFR